MILSDIIFSYSNFGVNIFSNGIKIYWVLTFLNFKWFLKRLMTKNSFHKLTQNTIIQSRTPESGHDTVKHFIEI